MAPGAERIGEMVTEAEAPPADTHSLDAYRRRLRRGQPWRWRGQVLQVVGQTIESAGPNSSTMAIVIAAASFVMRCATACV